ncbi:MAG: hypothetical protein AB7O24_24710 [Kofleriaceae bacterium]
MVNPWVCMNCGARMVEQGACGSCGHHVTLDMRDPQVRTFMRDTERRLHDQRAGKLRMAGLLLGMAVVFALWLIPGYDRLRLQVFALPVLMDQFILAAAAGLGLSKLLERRFARPRFPYLRADLSIAV